MHARLIGSALVVVAVAWSSGHAQVTGQRNPPLVIRSMVGQDLYQFYCASCHGKDGKGQGPVVRALKTMPPDLTTIARRHGGAFPRDLVEQFVTNDGAVLAPAHGTADMPVWGPIFRSLDPSDTLVKVRIANVVAYLESIQVK